MSVILDTGALVAIERGDREMLAVILRERDAGRPATTHAGVVAEVWRGGSGRQALLALALPGVLVRPIDDDLGRRVGLLLGHTSRRDVIDAAVVLLAEDGDEIFTGDPKDLRALAYAAGKRVDLIPI